MDLGGSFLLVLNLHFNNSEQMEQYNSSESKDEGDRVTTVFKLEKHS